MVSEVAHDLESFRPDLNQSSSLCFLGLTAFSFSMPETLLLQSSMYVSFIGFCLKYHTLGWKNPWVRSNHPQKHTLVIFVILIWQQRFCLSFSECFYLVFLSFTCLMKHWTLKNLSFLNSERKDIIMPILRNLTTNICKALAWQLVGRKVHLKCTTSH